MAGSDYFARIHRVVDWIDAHIDGDLSLERLSAVACLSPFHFHRVFKAFAGETLNAWVSRLRLERSVLLMMRRRDASITEIALEAGFSSPSNFARSFKAAYGSSASRFRDSLKREGPRASALLRKGPGSSFPPWESNAAPPAVGLDIASRPPMRAACLRLRGVRGPRAIGRAFGELEGMARAMGMDSPALRGILRDDPLVTAADKCRYDACLVLAPGMTAPAGLETLELAGGDYASLPSVRGTAGMADAWDSLYSWIVRSPWEVLDLPGMESFRRNKGRLEASVMLAVRRAP